MAVHTRRLFTIAVAIVATGTTLTSTDTTQAGPSAEGVSRLTYWPKPFYNDLHTMTVRFTTTGPAGRGREYFVVLELMSESQDEQCEFATLFPDDYDAPRVLGGRGKKHRIALDPRKMTLSLYSRFCAGFYQLRVGTSSIRNPSRKTLRWHRVVYLRIHRA